MIPSLCKGLRGVGLALGYIALLGEVGHAAPQAFFPGEQLVYDISYMGIDAGTGIMTVKDPVTLRGRAVYPVVSTAQSNDFVSLFYPVNDRVVSHIDAQRFYSHVIDVKQHQGKKRREKVIRFDQDRHIATQYKQGKSETFVIPPETQDSLSSIYFFRNQTLPPVGQSVLIPVHESEENWQVEIRILAKERVTTPVGIFDTVKVQARVPYQGIFLDKGDVLLWVTDDARHIPVKIHSTIKIGTIVATLISRRDSSRITGNATPLIPAVP